MSDIASTFAGPACEVGPMSIRAASGLAVTRADVDVDGVMVVAGEEVGTSVRTSMVMGVGVGMTLEKISQATGSGLGV